MAKRASVQKKASRSRKTKKRLEAKRVRNMAKKAKHSKRS